MSQKVTPRTISFELYFPLWTVNRFTNRIKNKKKVTAKGRIWKLTPRDPLFSNIFFSKLFPVYALGLIMWNTKILTYKCLRKHVSNAWIKFNIKTPINNFSQLIKPEIFNSFKPNLNYMWIMTIITFPMPPLKYLSFILFLFFHPPLFQSFKSKISKQ